MKRVLGSYEHILWLGGKENPANFLFVTRIEGQVSRAQIDSALLKLRRRHPLVAVRVAVDEGNIPWFTTEEVPPFDVREVTESHPFTWRDETKRELETFFFTESGPLVRFVLIWKENGLDFLTVCHHMLVDGLGVINLMGDLMRFLSDPKLNLPPLPLYGSIDQLIPPLNNPPDKIALKTTTQTHAAVILSGLPDKRTIAELQPVHSEILSFDVLAWSLNEVSTARFLGACQKHGVSVQSALSAAFLKVFSLLRGDDPPYYRRFSMPVNLRNRLTAKVDKAFALYVTPQLIIGVDCPPQDDLWRVAKRIYGTLQEEITDEHVFAPHFAVRKVIQTILDDTTPENDVDYDVAYDFALTNLGKLDLPSDYGDLKLSHQEALFLNGFRDERVIATHSFDGRLYFSMVMDRAFMQLLEMEQIRDLFCAEINAALPA